MKESEWVMKYGELSWIDIQDHHEKVVVLPVGSLEQHGHHLPMLTDSMIAEGILTEVEKELNGDILCLPMLWVGCSEHHLGYAGTISLRPEIYQGMIEDILESLIKAGFRRIFILNAHGGNETPGILALYQVELRHKDIPDLWLAFGSWMVIVGKKFSEVPDLQQDRVIHACEIETSLILTLHPALVRMAQAQGAVIPFESHFYTPDFSKGSRVVVPRSFDELSQTGAFGFPEKATNEKGEKVLQTAVQEVAAFLREFAAWQPIKPT
jgi:creatinine amidohydrolase